MTVPIQKAKRYYVPLVYTYQLLVMKSAIAPILLLFLLLSSCKKKEEVTQPTVDNKYSITTYPKVHAKPFSIKEFGLTVEHTSFSQPNRVSISIEGLPDGVSASISKNNERPPFDAVISLTVKYIKPGSYPFKLIAKTEGHLPKEADIILVVDSMSASDCSIQFGNDENRTVDTYNEAGEYISHNPRISVPASNPTHLYFLHLILGSSGVNKNYSSDGRYRIGFIVDCNKATITLPESKVAGSYLHTPVITHSVKGEGTIDFANNTFTLPYESTHLATGIVQKFEVRGSVIFDLE